MAFDPNQAALDEANRQAGQANQANYQQDINDRIQRAQDESDREYKLKVQKAKQDAEDVATRKGQAAATKWYQEQEAQLAKEKLAQDLQIEQMKNAETQREFNIGASGYLENGSPTLDRQKWQDTSLQGWTDKGLALSRLPKDWITLQRLEQGVNDNISSIPGLSWAAGGQVGNTTMTGQPQSNSLQNLMGNMGVNVGQGGAAGSNAVAMSGPTQSGNAAAPATGGNWADSAAQQANAITTGPLNLRPDQQQIYDTAREFGSNPQQAQRGWLEGLNPDLKDAIQGAAEDQGLSWSDIMARYNRATWGGGGSASAA